MRTGTAILGAVLLWSAGARAQEPGPDAKTAVPAAAPRGASASDPAKPVGDAPEVGEIPRVVVEEHRFVIVDEGQPRPGPVNEELETAPEWTWPARHLAAGSRFLDPFAGVEVYPEVSVGTSLVATQIEPRGTVAFGTALDVSLYLLDLQVPLVTSVDGARTEEQVRAALKIPFAWPGAENHRFALAWGAAIGPEGPSIAESSKLELLYGWGGPLELQAKVGYGYDQLLAGETLRQGLLYGLALGFRAGKFEPMLQLDGQRTTGVRTDQLAILPGFRIYPADTEAVQLGLGGLIVLTRGEGAPGRRWGATFDVSYNFL